MIEFLRSNCILLTVHLFPSISILLCIINVEECMGTTSVGSFRRYRVSLCGPNRVWQKKLLPRGSDSQHWGQAQNAHLAAHLHESTFSAPRGDCRHPGGVLFWGETQGRSGQSKRAISYIPAPLVSVVRHNRIFFFGSRMGKLMMWYHRH
jgi:hypothetical protein